MRYDRNVRPAKHWLARALGATGVSSALMRAQSLVYRNGYVRVVNYHDTPPEDAAQFEEHVRFYARHFSPVRVGDLAASKLLAVTIDFLEPLPACE